MLREKPIYFIGRVLVNSPKKKQLAKIALVNSPNYFGQVAKFLWSTRQIPLVNSPKNNTSDYHQQQFFNISNDFRSIDTIA